MKGMGLIYHAHTPYRRAKAVDKSLIVRDLGPGKGSRCEGGLIELELKPDDDVEEIIRRVQRIADDPHTVKVFQIEGERRGEGVERISRILSAHTSLPRPAVLSWLR